MNNVIEIKKPVVDALRMSAALPHAAKRGHLHILYADQFRPVGYLAHKPTNDRGLRGFETIYEDRYFATESLEDALKLLELSHDELPGGAVRRGL